MAQRHNQATMGAVAVRTKLADVRLKRRCSDRRNAAALRKLFSDPAGKLGQIREVIPTASIRRTRDIRGISSQARRATGQRSGRPLIFSVGRHVYYKGFDVLIHAMRDLDADLWIGGRGPLSKTLVQLAHDLGLAERVKFVGFVPDPLLMAYYQACDVFCLPSVERAEQFGLVQLEAMYSGKPIVATRLGTGVEYVTLNGETGLLVPPKDPRALADACVRIWATHTTRTNGSRWPTAGRSKFSP